MSGTDDNDLHPDDLMRAAPDLYRALADILRQIRRDPYIPVPVSNDSLDVAEWALRKARGEQ